ncbi:protein FAR1-RELATED SEQUENCE 5-like [Cornus florida]|uniref:protein FAR1-RELATED SEQUENCE 5-like n=1 Tax=Cornus florida TaxID=4283 RepID=UPI00289854A6|nr:protein FAR1-RELATED SEQUENCE 5-like [Cornus florida]
MDKSEVDWKPKYGMEFDYEEKAFEFYNEYGRRVGFSVRKDHANKSPVIGEVTSRLYVCCKEGFRRKDKRDYLTKNPRAETRMGYGALMNIKLNRSKGKFWVNKFVEQHNHSLGMEACAHMMPSQRKLSTTQTIEVDLANESGIPLQSTYELLGRHAGGRECLGYTKRDQKNYIRSKRQRDLAYGEAGSLLKYFQKQCLEHPSFFYAVQLNKDEQITNIFWADGIMIIDYALMHDETIDSFIWLFETFLEAMSNKKPKTIFIDQDAAMAKALTFVMPETCHQLCTWHIMQNAVKDLSILFKTSNGIKAVLTKLMDDYEKENEFTNTWDNMLSKYNVCENTWLHKLFELITKWAKAYLKREWSAGMRSIQLSESLNASIKDYLKSDHDLPEVFKHFERILHDKRYKELEAEYGLCYKLPKIKMHLKMLVHASTICTNAIFEEFQRQYEISMEADIKGCKEDGEIYMYTVDNNQGRECQGAEIPTKSTSLNENTSNSSVMCYKFNDWELPNAYASMNVKYSQPQILNQYSQASNSNQYSQASNSLLCPQMNHTGLTGVITNNGFTRTTSYGDGGQQCFIDATKVLKLLFLAFGSSKCVLDIVKCGFQFVIVSVNVVELNAISDAKSPFLFCKCQSLHFTTPTPRDPITKF